MRKAVDAVVDLLSGLLLGVVFFIDGRVLLQTRTFVYLAFPLFCTIAFAIGFWRRRRSSLPFAVTAILASTPVLLMALYFYSARNKPFIIFPIVAVVFIAIGGMVSRRMAIAALIAANIAAAFAGPPFIGLIVHNQLVTEKAIPFAIRLVNGQTISSQQLRGRVVVLDFWATWCIPCQRELPVLQRVYDKMNGRRDVAFFAVDGVITDSGEEGGDTAERAAEYFRRGRYSIPLAWDRGAVLEKAFSLSGFPTLLVLDAGGQVRMRHVGFIGSENLESVLTRTIDEVASTPETR